MKKKKKTFVAVSGGFDPVHIGHIRLFREARKLGDELIVILNNDHWLKKKKGYVFMPQHERKEILEAFHPVDRVVISKHRANPSDVSIVKELLALRPHIFANGGDRKPGNLRTEEGRVCLQIGCKEIFNVGQGGKIQSSSTLIHRTVKKLSSR